MEERMRAAGIVRGISTVAAGTAGAVGALMTVAAVVQWVTPTPHDSAEHRGQLLALAVAGLLLIGYWAAHLAVRRRPRSGWAIASRAVFTVAGTLAGARLAWAALNFLAEARPQACGLPAVAALFHLMLVAGFLLVELAAWADWWVSCRVPAEPPR
jgi:hypothetical protein